MTTKMKPDLGSQESATCTICGLKCDDRAAFNAHIRAHLKDKLTNRRKLQEQQMASTSSLESAKKAKKAAAAVTAVIAATNTTATAVNKAAASSVKPEAVKDIQSLLPSSPLPLSSTSQPTFAPVKPDLEVLLNQFQTSKMNQDNSPMVMAELAACKPIPPPPLSMPSPMSASAKPLLTKLPTVESNPVSPSLAATSTSHAPCTPEISDMEDADLMSYEMEMNRIDFHNDLASILDQIEKDFESPSLDIGLDTPPDSDCENPIGPGMQPSPRQESDKHQLTTSPDLMGFERFTQRIENTGPGNPGTTMLKSFPDESMKNMRLVQSPASVARVGKLPAKTLAVLNKLPAKLFLPEDSLGMASASALAAASTLPANANPAAGNQSIGMSKEQRFVDVVKVESQAGTGAVGGSSISSLLTAGTQCIINIECRQKSDEPAKIIQTFRAIDTGSEIKLVPADLPIKVETRTPPIAVHDKDPKKSTSHCAICNKCITNKNMARHLEKHANKKASSLELAAAGAAATAVTHFACKICCKTFGQRSHLSRHVKAVHEGQSLTCKVCGKVCKNRLNLLRHRAKHLACVHCSALFESKVSLQDHLVKAHPEKAILSLVQPPEPAPKLDFDSDDLGSMASSYSFSPVPSAGPPSLPEMPMGESLADIADSNYFFCGNSDITDDLYSTDLFATAAQTC